MAQVRFIAAVVQKFPMRLCHLELHRYVILVYKQPNGHITFDPITSGRGKWKVERDLANKYNLQLEFGNFYQVR